MKTKTFDVYCDVYGVNLLVILGLEKSKIAGLLKRRFKVDCVKEYGEFSNELGGCVLDFDKWPYHVLWVGNVSKNDIVPKIAHEVFHHVLRVCQKKQIPTYPEIDNLIMDEPAAYLMEFYMREILKKLKK